MGNRYNLRSRKKRVRFGKDVILGYAPSYTRRCVKKSKCTREEAIQLREDRVIPRENIKNSSTIFYI